MDLFLEWQSDFLLSGTGGLTLVEGNDFARQRLERRLFTPVAGYVWHKEYGAGLPQKIGDPWTVGEIQAIVLSQVGLEASVAFNPPAQVGVNEVIPGMVNIDVAYTAAQTGIAVNFTITS